MNIENYINGEMRASHSGAVLDNYNPASGKVYGTIPNSDAKDVAEAYAAAAAAFPVWSNTPAEERFKVLNAIAEGIDNLRDALAMAESNDQGKPLWLAKNEMIRAAQNFRFFATAAMQFSSESHAMENRAINYTLRTPIGVVGCISPWNLPLYLFTWKIAPALAAGNCVVAKPSEFTPVTAAMLGEICTAAGLPNGVLNIVHGLGGLVGQAIVEHPSIKAISFTGGTATGKHIASVAGPMFKKVSLELGGKNPNIIFADCDFDDMLSTTIRSSFANQGQICLCGSRIFVERPIYEKFKEAFVAKVSKSKVSFPTDPEAKLGAIVSESHMEKILSYIELAKQEGGTVLTGGKRVHLAAPYDQGYYIEPTIIEGLSYDCRTNQEEIFGPVVTITPFDTEEEALMMANSTEYGLAGTIWTSNLKRAHRVADELQSGIVWVNAWLVRDRNVALNVHHDTLLVAHEVMPAVASNTDARHQSVGHCCASFLYR